MAPFLLKPPLRRWYASAFNRENMRRNYTMRKLIPGMLVGAALLLGACGSPASVNDAANQAATAAAEPTTAAALNDAANQAATAIANPTNAAALNDAAN